MSSHRRALRAPLALVCALTLLLAACGDADGSGTGLSTEIDATAGAAPEPSATEPTAASDPTADAASADGPVEPGSDTFGVEVAGDAGEAPQITVPDDEPPAELVVVDLVEGDGEVVEPGATVTTHYTGVSWLNDGEQFDSSWDRGEPATFPLEGVIPGWTEGIPGMKVGGRRLLIIPPDMAYGDQSPTPAIAPNDTLVFVIDLVEPPPAPEPIEPGTDTFGVEVEGAAGEAPQITLPGGEPPAELVVVDLVEGDGEVVEPGATVTTHYTGVSWLNDGEQFDSSWERGEPATFPLSGVIPGWTEGIPGMKVGGRRLLIIPPDQGYGDAGRPPAIAPNDTLVFVIDLTDIG